MPTKRSLYFGWLPKHPEVHAAFLRTHVTPYAPNAPVLAPPPTAATDDLDKLVKAFFKAINDSEDMKSRFDLIFRQVNKDPKWAPADEDFRVHDLAHLEKALTSAISGPPKVYNVLNMEGKRIGEPIGIPIYLVLDLLINTDAAHDLFRMDEFNVPMKAMLDGWGKYLMDEESGSNSTLTTADDGWLGPYGLPVLQQGLRGLSFNQTYGVKPDEAQQKYKSWDKFFTRDIQDFDRLRPVILPELYASIHNACESTTLRTAHNVKHDDTFWLKTQNYSLWDMLGGKRKNSLAKYADQFIGGSVYQAFLAPQDYHHWHSPIKGTILDTAVVPGTYYAAVPDDGAPEGDPHLKAGDPHGALMRSQPWLCIEAARGVIIIKPEEPSPIELVGFIGIGMVEVSTIDIRVSNEPNHKDKPNKVEAGQHLGMFHFGGSSHVVIVKPKEDYRVVFKDMDDEDLKPNEHRWVREIIGRVVKPEEA